VAAFARQLPAALKTNFAETMKTLRNEAFRDLLKNYQRAKRGG
jgi:hypothetical protein